MARTLKKKAGKRSAKTASKPAARKKTKYVYYFGDGKADGDGKMNLSLADVGGEVLVVPQFTLYGDTRRGRRPSWVGAAPPEVAAERVEAFASALEALGARVGRGAFREHMEVELVNDGPVTILLDGGRPAG